MDSAHGNPAPEARVVKAICGSTKSPLRIAGVEIPCYVLEDGTRIIAQRGIYKAINMSSGRRKGPNSDRLLTLVRKIDGQGAPFKDLAARLEHPILFHPPGNSRWIGYGYEATILADLCDAILGARKLGLLHPSQEHIAERCELLVRGFARVGIIALVDEATGYQRIRDRNELHRILDAYIAKELLPWTKRFPDEFYRELFRLKGWTFSPPSPKRPMYVGKLTNELVYERMPPGVLEELRARNPVVSNGRRRHKHHQFLTEDVGHPHLERHLVAVITLMRASKSWNQFMKLFQTAFPKERYQLTLDLDKDSE
jgi:hypothetical protein